MIRINLSVEKQFAILTSILELDGEGTKQEVLDNINENKYLKFNEHDLKVMKNRNELTWRNNLAFRRKDLVEKGLINGSKGNQWKITDNGKTYFINVYLSLIDQYKNNYSKLTESAIIHAKDIIDKTPDLRSRIKKLNTKSNPTYTLSNRPYTNFETSQGFGLEKHLNEFLCDNWSSISLGKEWSIYSEPDDDFAGYEYSCSVGRIDILARHRTKPQWLVIELKRDQSSDNTVGQLLRYIGWVKHNLANNREEVFGLIVAHTCDDSLKYAISTVPNVDIQLYDVQFQLVSSKNFLN
jgi:hypothetical protein